MVKNEVAVAENRISMGELEKSLYRLADNARQTSITGEQEYFEQIKSAVESRFSQLQDFYKPDRVNLEHVKDIFLRGISKMSESYRRELNKADTSIKNIQKYILLPIAALVSVAVFLITDSLEETLFSRSCLAGGCGMLSYGVGFVSTIIGKSGTSYRNLGEKWNSFSKELVKLSLRQY